MPEAGATVRRQVSSIHLLSQTPLSRGGFLLSPSIGMLQTVCKTEVKGLRGASLEITVGNTDGAYQTAANVEE